MKTITRVRAIGTAAQRTIFLAVAAALTIAGLAVAAPATASVPAASGAPVASAPAVTAAAPVTTAASCPITRFGYTGYYICGTKYADKTWPGSHQKETFVIGLDKAVWHIHSGTHGWKSLGGVVKSRVSAFVEVDGRRSVQSYGTDNRLWCRGSKSGKWNKWHHCDVQGIAWTQEQAKGTCKNYFGCPNPGQWCADFGRWVWRNANVRGTSQLNSAAASFWQYGKRYRTLHTSKSYKPKPGDAIVFQINSNGTYAKHVGTVIYANSRGVTVEIGGNQGNKVSRWTSRAGARVGDKLGSWRISGFVQPRYYINS